MVEEARQLSSEELCVYEVFFKNEATLKDINDQMSEKEKVDYKLLDDYLFREKTSKTLVGLTIEKAKKGGWPGNREEVLQLLKILIEKKVDFTRTLAVESKSQAPRDCLKILLEIIFSQSIVALEPEPDAGNKNLEEIAANAAAENTHFLWAIEGLYRYYCCKKNQNSVPAASRSQYKTLEIKRKELQLHKIEAHPHFRCLKWFLETGILNKDNKDDSYPKSRLNQYHYIPGSEELSLPADDIIQVTLQIASDIRDEIPDTDSYLRREYQKLCDQAEEFAVALTEEVQEEKELSAVMMMEDKFSGKDAFQDSLTWTRGGNISLIQHAINLRCKSFVVSKNCQHLLKKVVFGQSSYRLWDKAIVVTDTGMLSLFVLLVKIFLSFLCAAFMTFLAVPVYVVLSLVSLSPKKKWSACRSQWFELLERPCQIYILDLWWYIGLLILVIITSCEKNFSQTLQSGLTLPDIFLFFFVVTLLLRRLISFCLHLQTFSTIPRYQRNWRLILPEPLTSAECVSLLCFTTAFSLWMSRWNQLHGWRPSDKDYQRVDVFYSLGTLLCFFKLAHYLKAHRTLGTLNLSLYMMITKDVIYFAIIFVVLLYIPFATTLEKMYSYYVVDSDKNATHPLASYTTTYNDLLWAMLGSVEKEESEISDTRYAYVTKLGETLIILFIIAAVVVAFNMLVATMNHTYEDIMRNVDKEYLFSRTRMWMEYITQDHSSLPPPLNLAGIILWGCVRATRSLHDEPKNEASQEDRFKEKQKERISIINRLVFRYLLRSLGLNNSEYSHDILIPGQSSASQPPPVV